MTVGMGFAYLRASRDNAHFVINQVRNHSSYPVNLLRYVINALGTKKLSRPVEIPFISALNDRIAFIEERPYLPHQALMIEVGDYRWAIWQDETGVLCAPDDREGLYSYEERIPRRLIRYVMDKTLYNSNKGTIFTALLVKASGQLYLEQEN